MLKSKLRRVRCVPKALVHVIYTNDSNWPKSEAQAALFSVRLFFKSCLTKPVYQKLVMFRHFVERQIPTKYG